MWIKAYSKEVFMFWGSLNFNRPNIKETNRSCMPVDVIEVGRSAGVAIPTPASQQKQKNLKGKFIKKHQIEKGVLVKTFDGFTSRVRGFNRKNELLLENCSFPVNPLSVEILSDF
ncbi:MAG: hypothetical protein ACOCUF_02960 [Patescibacteria group bacterium]